jgi:MFS family permease
VLAVVVSVAFVVWERRTPSPVVDVRLFRDARFVAACASIGLSNLVMYTTLLALPLYLERVRERDVQTSGLILAALSAFSAIWGPLGGRWTDRAGRWLPAVTGGLAVIISVAILSPGVRATSLVPLIVALALMGLGIGLQGAPVQTAAIDASPSDKTGSAAGIFSTSRYLGSVLGSSVLAVLFAHKPGPGESATFGWLFAGLAGAAVLGMIVNTRIAARRP